MKRRNKINYKYCQKVGNQFKCTFTHFEEEKEMVCGRTFQNKSNFQVHERMHTGERPFNCQFCDKTFASSGNRREHQRRHTQTRLYECDHHGCQNSYHRYSQLVYHSLKCHNVKITPKKKGYGGRAKYVDVGPHDLNLDFVPIEDVQIIQPIFQIEKVRAKNISTGQLEELEIPIKLEQKPIKSKLERRLRTQKYQLIDKRQREDKNDVNSQSLKTAKSDTNSHKKELPIDPNYSFNLKSKKTCNINIDLKGVTGSLEAKLQSKTQLDFKNQITIDILRKNFQRSHQFMKDGLEFQGDQENDKIYLMKMLYKTEKESKVDKKLKSICNEQFMKQIIIKTSYNQLHDQSLFIRDDHYNEKNVIHNILFKKPAGRASLNPIDI